MPASARGTSRLAVPTLVLLACVLLCVLPGTVAAAPPSNDDYLDSIGLNARGSVLPTTLSVTGHTIVEATTEADMFASDPQAPLVPEPTVCERPGVASQGFNSTVWYDVYPHVPGNLQVVALASTFTAMVAVVPFDPATGLPDLSRYRCIPATLGRAQLDYDFRLEEGLGYSIQIGGAAGIQGLFDMTVSFSPDSDRDGPVDSADQCPAEPGPAGLGGCPDGDGDGIRNADDRCGSQAGPAAHGGCPDSDGDGVANPNDRCVGQPGPAAFGGCPDRDGDGIADPDDACPRENARKGRDRNQNGCPDRELLKPAIQLVPGSYCPGGVCLGLSVEKLVVSEIPKGTRVTVRCTRRACKRVTKKAGRSRKVTFFSGQNVPAGAKIVVDVQRAGFAGRRQSYSIGRNTLDKGRLSCLAGRKASRCSNKLLIR